MEDWTVVVRNLAEMVMNEHQWAESEQLENLWHDEPVIANHVGHHHVTAFAATDGATTTFSTW